jgi:protein-L-isoaspartate O-methyltransferase
VSGDRAIDVGCGTGFQTAILDGLGYQTVRIDIAGALVAGARDKLAATESWAQL